MARDTNCCRIIYISEILRVILDNLTDDKRSIVFLAYSSKIVSDLALDYLWADMDSFAGPFVPLLPKPVQEIWDLPFTIPMLPVIKCPPPEEWKHFDMYAYRVRRINPRLGDFFDCALYQMLTSIRPGVDLFPKLSVLHCHLFNPLTPETKIFPSSLRSLSLYPKHAFQSDDRVELALRQAAHDAPFLEELYIGGIYRHRESGSHPLNFKRLHTVHLIASDLRPVDLRSFSRLLSTAPIRDLGISVRSSSEVSFQLDDTGVSPRAFPHLETISIFDSPGRAADIVSGICSPHLESVTIEHDYYASISEYGRFFTLLALRRPHIYSLEVKIDCIYVATPNEYVRGFLAVLEPLVHAGLAELRVEMSLNDTWKIEGDVKMRLQPEAWPSLTYFKFWLMEASTFLSSHLVEPG